MPRILTVFLAQNCCLSKRAGPKMLSVFKPWLVFQHTAAAARCVGHHFQILCACTQVVSFEQLIKGTNSTSPCTRPRVFLLAFLETNPCPTLYPTLCFWKQLRSRGILRFLGFQSRWKAQVNSYQVDVGRRGLSRGAYLAYSSEVHFKALF